MNGETLRLTDAPADLRRAAELLRANEGRLHQLASYLYEHETITGEEFMEILSRSSPELDAPAEQPEA